MTWPFEDVVEIHRRWFELSDRGLEIFLTNGKTCLLAFDSSQVTAAYCTCLSLRKLAHAIYREFLTFKN